MRRIFGLILCLCFVEASAFIPPVGDLISEVLGGRKGSEAVELQFRHNVTVRDGETVEVIETFTGNRSGAIVQWQIAGQPAVYSDWNQKEYVFRNSKSIASRTGVFIDYLLASSASEFQERLLKERFLRRDQLLIFKPGYVPAGDPKNWETRANYLNHSDVAIEKVGNEFAYAIVGMSEGDQRRAFYISRTGKALSRLEWGVGSETAVWDFSNSVSMPGIGKLPRLALLKINGATRVATTLSSAKPTRRDTVATLRNASRQASSSSAPSALLEEAIRLIVRYR
jgi:hypothetical protein